MVDVQAQLMFRQAIADPNNPGQLLYRSPGSNTNLGELLTYHPAWSIFSNLTAAQIAALVANPQDLLSYLSTRRWQAEISGTTIGGIPVLTDDRSKMLVGQMRQAFDDGIISSVPFFDASNNIQTLDKTGGTALHVGMVTFVQQTFATAATLVAGITASPPTITTRAQIDAAIAAIAPNSPSAKTPSPT